MNRNRKLISNPAALLAGAVLLAAAEVIYRLRPDLVPVALAVSLAGIGLVVAGFNSKGKSKKGGKS